MAARQPQRAQHSAASSDAYRLRRLGYIVRPGRDPLAARIERAGGRLVSLNRLRPGEGHRYTECPRCGAWDGLWLDWDGTWSTLCGCAPGGDAIDLAMFLAGAA